MSTDAEIIEAIEQYWEAHHRPVLLSVLGGLLSQGCKEDIAGAGATLGQYIRSKLGESIRLLKLASHGGGAVPKSKTDGLSDNDLEARVPAPIQKLGLARTKSPKFHDSLWTLFRNADVELPVFVELPNSGETVVHSTQPEDSNRKVYEVVSSDFPPHESRPVPISAVARSIRMWASRHDIPLSSIQSVGDEPAARDTERRLVIGAVGLGDALNLLSPDELRRISIPADILLNVLRRL